MEAGGWRGARAAIAFLSVTAATTCFLLSAHLSGAGEGRVGLLSVLGINLGFFAELNPGQYAPGFPTGGDVQWLNSEVLPCWHLPRVRLRCRCIVHAPQIAVLPLPGPRAVSPPSPSPASAVTRARMCLRWA